MPTELKMLELCQIVDAAKQYEQSSLPLELRGAKDRPYVAVAAPNGLNQIKVRLKYLFGLGDEEQRELTDCFIRAMLQSHANSEAISKILHSEKIRLNSAITAKQALRAYRKLELIEMTRYEFIENVDGKGHGQLKFIHGLILKIKTYFRR